MPLPMSKGELNRLGDRLIAGERASDADLADLAVALAAYQEVLGQVTAHLRNLGFAPSGRVKTITTMTDKLRRTQGMQLSRMQDFAGVRFVVSDLAAQDEAKDKIADFYAAQGCPCRVIDRRADPRFGYRAVHVVVRIDDMPVEIQIRTNLQDTWAQIVERLADRWGRGIRYGEDPEYPEAIVESANVSYSRRDAMTMFMELSEAMSKVEQIRHVVNTDKQQLESLRLVYEHAKNSFGPGQLEMKIPPEVADGYVVICDQWLSVISEDVDAQGRELLELGADATGAQFLRVIEIFMDTSTRQTSARSAELEGFEERLRDTLQGIASAIDEGVV